jgi:hypothetical protein
MKPILMDGQMVRATLDGRKTLTHRPLKRQPGEVRESPFSKSGFEDTHGWHIEQPYAHPGDLLYVRENWRTLKNYDDIKPSKLHPGVTILYEADKFQRLATADWMCSGGWRFLKYGKLRPSIFMPKWARRIVLEVLEVRLRRIQTIEHTHRNCKIDVIEEGLPMCKVYSEAGRLEWFAGIWDALYKKSGLGWDDNPWAWAYYFRRNHESVTLDSNWRARA